MAENAIQVENLSKKYILSHIQKRSGSFREAITDTMKSAGGRLLSPFRRKNAGAAYGLTREEFWALNDVSFSVASGDRVGIIGRNGAGKSTLLKVLSRIVEPTRGRLAIRGRVASLLEVGTGFHPELTGRENIFLNGAILGMRRSEIKAKFDEIVAFSEAEKFLDTPVKRYSSGMYVRLAFAVAAHLEPEILIIDEVLAVGDAQFQRKCLGKIEDVSNKEGRTVLFVSHNMESVLGLCNHGILLKSGQIAARGPITDVVMQYNNSVFANELTVDSALRRGGSGEIRVSRVWVENKAGKAITNTTSGEPLNICMEASVSKAYRNGKSVIVGFGIDNVEGKRLMTCVSAWVNHEIFTKGETLRVRCKLPYLPLVLDDYLISVSVSQREDTLDFVEHCAKISVIRESETFFNIRAKEHGFIDLNYSFLQL